MVGVWNVWQLAAVPGSGLVLPASGLFVLQSEAVQDTPTTACRGPWNLPCASAAHLFALPPYPLVWVLIFSRDAVWPPRCSSKSSAPISAKPASAVISLRACRICPGGPGSGSGKDFMRGKKKKKRQNKVVFYVVLQSPCFSCYFMQIKRLLPNVKVSSVPCPHEGTLRAAQ